jgi:SagB-type dehydrogenase family enzyme
VSRAADYHQQTKHSFNRFARSLGYLDWAAQPNPFRRYDGAAVLDLPRASLRDAIPYEALFDGTAAPAAVNPASVGEWLRCSMGLSAWKHHQAARWPLRVNPSSGNLHPTETFLVWDRRVCHYAPREHVLEVRAELAPPAETDRATLAAGVSAPTLLVGLTSIVWREAWKYGERAFRYCQHDVGHAIGALRFSAALLGWQLHLLTEWPDDDIATLLGVDRAGDFGEAEREEPECVMAVSIGPRSAGSPHPGDEPAVRAALVASARAAVWSGRANLLSPSHVEWPVIDAAVEATRRSRA